MKRRLKWIFVAVVAIAALDYALYPRFKTPAPRLTVQNNAVWLPFSWASGISSETTSRLAARLERNGFQTAYFHVRYIGQSGRLRFRDAPKARRLNAEMKRAAPQIRRMAWLYIGNSRGITGVDITNPEIRRRIANETRFLTQKCGFDGVQLDYEICADGDADFLQLLREVRAAIPGKPLSVATPMWLPAPLGAWGWSEAYFGKVAQGCDEIAIMAYDSGLYFPRHYVWLVGQQIARVPRAAKLANSKCQVLLGVPSYETGGASHWPYAENLELALRAARKNQGGLNIDGLALFADQTTDAREWQTWRAGFSALKTRETQN